MFTELTLDTSLLTSRYFFRQARVKYLSVVRELLWELRRSESAPLMNMQAETNILTYIPSSASRWRILITELRPINKDLLLFFLSDGCKSRRPVHRRVGIIEKDADWGAPGHLKLNANLRRSSFTCSLALLWPRLQLSRAQNIRADFK